MRLKITGRFVSAVATAAVAPLLVFGIVSIYSLRTANETSVAEGNLNVARQVAQQVAQYMSANVKILRAVAAELRSTDLRQWQQDRILKDYVLDFPEFRELTLLAVDGTTIATSRIGEATLGVPSSDEGDAPTIAPITIDDDLLPTTTVTVPLTRLGRREGWLIGEVSLEELWRTVDAIRVGTQGFALLVAKDGRLIAHGNPNDKPRVAAGENLREHPIVAAMSGRTATQPIAYLAETGAQPSHREYSTADGRTLLGVAAPVAALGWTVIVEQPTSEAFALAAQLQLELVVIITLALIATVTLGYYWGQSFIRPIFALIKGTQSIAQGQLDDRVTIGGHDEFHQLGEAFNGMADKLGQLKEDVRKQERQAMFGRIAAGLVHDISHPIQNIANSCKLILKLRDDEEYRDTFQRTVDREFSSIKRVLEDLRNLARPMPLERFPIDINRAIQETVDSMDGLATTAGLTLNSRLSQQPLYIEGDLFALGRVYRNLIVNAIEATSPGGSITVTTQDQGDRARITIGDTGTGIPPERLDAIFEDFKTTKRRGLGLGLAISRKIVEQLGGSISVTSQVGKGTTFTIDLERTKRRPFPTELAAS